jgi:broad specificity polyphosphatase/5'/3'-nucleotidase SurE
MAVSTSPSYYEAATENMDKIWDYFVRYDLFKKNSMYNVNIPTGGSDEFRITRQGGPYYSDEFTLRDGIVYPHGIDVFQPCGSEEVDTDCVLRCGMISITPMTNQRANMPLFEQLRTLNA